MLKGFFKALLDLIFPPLCLSCGKNLKDSQAVDNLVCACCWNKIEKNIPPFCFLCGRHNPDPAVDFCPACLMNPPDFDRAHSATSYCGVVKKLIRNFKYKNKEWLNRMLAGLMVEFINQYNIDMESIDCLIPIPLDTARLREREFNQSELLSDNLSAAFGKPVLNNILKRSRHSRPQVGLKKEHRMTNIAGGFAVINKERIEGKRIMLIDDVLTTGATLSQAALCLKSAGAEKVFALTLAN